MTRTEQILHMRHGGAYSRAKPKDAALQKIETDRAKATPMPLHIRQKIKELRS